MARFRAVNVLDEQAWVEFDYGADGIVTDIFWANESDQPVHVVLTGRNNVVVADLMIQPGQSGSRRLTNPQRFHYEDETGAYGLSVGTI